MKSIEHYYEQGDKAFSVLKQQLPQNEHLNDLGFANVVLWKKYCEWEGIVDLNETNDKKIRLINDRIPKYLDFIDNTLDCMETKKVLMDKFEELFSICGLKDD